MHVLSTPPAFILSQDQTLNKMVSKERLRSSNHLIEAQFIASKKSIQEPSSSSLRLLRRTSRPFWCFVFLSRCLIYKVHARSRSRGQLIYIIISRALCQHLFSFFLSTSRLKDLLKFDAASSKPDYYTQLNLSCQALFYPAGASSRARPELFVPRSSELD